MTVDRAVLVQRGLFLNGLTLTYNVVEAVVAITAGTLAGSVALLGFGVDSVIEVTASIAAMWRLRADVDVRRRAEVERRTARIIGASFLALAAFVIYESVKALWSGEKPDDSVLGLVILTLSVIVMPVLARAKKKVALALESRSLEADAKQTSLCAYLSVIALTGVGLNAALGWWWADPAAALVMVPIIAKEGIEGVRGDSHCEDCA